MATQAHCFYCFECLLASFENRDPPTLGKVEGLWEEYQKSLLSENGSSSEILEDQPSEEDPAAEDTEDVEDTDEEESPEQDEDEGEDEGELEDDGANQISSSLTQPRPRPQIPSISRLRAPTPGSRSSSSSTPSTLSASSSNTALTTAASSTTSISTTSTNQHPTYASRLSQTASYPLFVTWNTHSRTSGHKSLRGCIGTFDPLPLPSGLQNYALTSAFEDTRFSPIPQSLLPSLSCSLTLLANFESCGTPLDWSLGTHGLRITFVYRGRRYGATYLPDVALDQGWTKEETLDSLMRKAGWDGGGGGGGGAGALTRRFLRGGRDRFDGGTCGQGRPWEEVSDFRAIRYTGFKASATYGEWREWRSWVKENDGRALK